VKLVYEIDGRVRARIEEDEAAGFYLYIFDRDSGACTHDHLQNTVEVALEQAEEDFALAKDKWRRVS
jgi:hypothetical protein